MTRPTGHELEQLLGLPRGPPSLMAQRHLNLSTTQVAALARVHSRFASLARLAAWIGDGRLVPPGEDGPFFRFRFALRRSSLLDNGSVRTSVTLPRNLPFFNAHWENAAAAPWLRPRARVSRQHALRGPSGHRLGMSRFDQGIRDSRQ